MLVIFAKLTITCLVLAFVLWITAAELDNRRAPGLAVAMANTFALVFGVVALGSFFGYLWAA